MSAIIDRHFQNPAIPIKLGNVIREVSCRNKSKQAFPVLSVSNRFGFVTQNEQFSDRVIASEDTSNYKIVKKEDFAYNPARINVGSIALLKNYKVGIVSPMYVCFQCNDSLLPEYLELFFESRFFQLEVERRLEGSVRQCLSFEGLQSITISLPNIRAQLYISHKIALIEGKIELETSLLDNYQRQRLYLLSQMFI